MGLPRPEWDFQGRNWQVGRKHVPQELGTGRQGDGKRNLPQEMGHLRWELAGRETVSGICRRRWDIQGMGLPRPELAGREMGRVIYHMTWDFQGRNGTSKAGTGRLGGNICTTGVGNWQAGRREEEFTAGMEHLRWELAGRETVRGICRRRWDIQGRRI